MRAIDCQGLGGGFTLGVIQSGFELLHKVEQPGGFGIKQMNDNRHLLTGDWTYQGDDQASEWRTDFEDVDLLFANPPCSGFSTMSIRAGGLDNFRGADSPANSCMWDLFAYAAKIRPKILVMESVQPAYRREDGLGLMRTLWKQLEAATGIDYHLTHVLHNSAACGGASIRKRYFMVLSSLGPMSFNPECEVAGVPTFGESCGDLWDLPLTFEDQPRTGSIPPSWWAEPRADTLLVSGHDLKSESSHSRRLEGAYEIGWPANARLADLIKANWFATGGSFDDPDKPTRVVTAGQFPTGWPNALAPNVDRPLMRANLWDRLEAGEITAEDYLAQSGSRSMPKSRPQPFQSGVYQPVRWPWERAGRVLAGNALEAVVHPVAPRTLTYREVARIMGFPDSWNVGTYVGSGGQSVFGKAVTVEAGRWIATNVMNQLQGRAWPWYGEELNERERVVDKTHDHKQVYNERTGERGDFRSSGLKKLMDARMA